MDGVSPPTNWAALIDQNAALLDASMEMLRERPDEANVARAGTFNAAPASLALVGVSGILAQAAISRGAKASHELFAVLGPLVPRTIEELSGKITNQTRAFALSLLSLQNVAECCGVMLPTVYSAANDQHQLQADWIQAIGKFGRHLDNRDCIKLSLLALSAAATPPEVAEAPRDASSSIIDNELELAVKVIGGGALPKSFVPAQTFEFNTQGFIRYLALAVREKRALTDVLPALQSFIRHFPHKLAAGQLDWDDLLLAGRVVFSTIGHEPADQVADAMCALVTTQMFEGGL